MLLQRGPFGKQESGGSFPSLPLLENPLLKSISLDIVDSSGNTDLKPRFSSQRRRPGLGVSLCVRYKKVRRVTRAAGVHIDAMPSAVAVRHRDRCPALAHRSSIRLKANKRRLAKRWGRYAKVYALTENESSVKSALASSLARSFSWLYRRIPWSPGHPPQRGICASRPILLLTFRLTHGPARSAVNQLPRASDTDES